MTGPEHFDMAEALAAEARKHLGQGEGQDTAAVWAAVAQVHATLALAAATALGTRDADSQAWVRVAGTEVDPFPKRVHKSGETHRNGPPRPIDPDIAKWPFGQRPAP